ncbi:MAG: peptide chain release factor N(5)-glutamine methyltransferase [Cyclobacteriaceae bacterium]|jgi:release factor glutamine methyltransferase|nr:peptide chain release factor N(5)-glutamine methyltransferase [Flammeovirgaceae bacterium]
MTKSKLLFHELLNRIVLSDRPEAEAIVYYLLEARFGITRQDVWNDSEVEVDHGWIESAIQRINEQEPVQYVTGVAWFCGHRFQVNASVLIPRPETEQLVEEVKRHVPPNAKVLDVGTGSGCIAISLALAMPDAQVFALDVSADALKVAQQNAAELNAIVTWLQADFLRDVLPLKNFDCIVSNPPYIRELEKSSMEPNVLRFEPHLALFVSDSNPLIFYQALAEKGKVILKMEGKILAEINAQLSSEVKLLFEKEGYQSVQLIKDMEGKNRFVSATWLG